MATFSHLLLRRVATAKPALHLTLFHSFSDSEQHDTSPPTCNDVAKRSLPPLQPSPEADALSHILIWHQPIPPYGFLWEMFERGIEPNVVTYNVLLNGICRRASLHPETSFERVIMEAEKVFDEMCDSGLEPDGTSYSILLHVYSQSHKPQLCLDKLMMMKRKGASPIVATYTSVVKCLCSCGRMGDAEEMLNEMVQYGVSPTAETYNCFLKE